MKDKSKRLTVVNTGKKPAEKKEVQQIVVQPSSSSSSHAPGFNPNLYLLKSVWDSVFEIKTDGSGQKYIFGKLPVVTKYGITMYADDGSLNLPSIYEGLPIDGVTLYWDNGVLKAKGGEGGGGGVADSIAWANVYGKPSWVTDTKPIYNYSEIKNTPDLSVFVTDTALNNTLADYATLTYLTGELKKYVTLDGAQDITGIKDFINGLKIGGIELIKKQDDVVYLDGNLVVKGGITMYGDGEGGSSVPLYSTLGSLLNVDESNDAVASVDRVLFQSAGSNVWSWKALSEIGGGSVSGDYLPLSGGILTGSVTFQTNGNNAFYINEIGEGNAGFAFQKNGSTLGAIRLDDNREPSWMYSKTWTWETMLHSGNYSSYALPLSGGQISGHIYMTGAKADSSIGNTTQIVFGTPSDNHVCITSNRYGIIINRSLSDTSNQVALYADADSESFIQSHLRIYGNLFSNIFFSHGGSLAKQSDASMYTWDNHLQINKRAGMTYVKTLLSFDLVNETATFNLDSQLRFNSNMYWVSDSTNPHMALVQGGHNWYVQISQGYMFLGAGATYSLRIDASGNILAPGGITMYSDQRKKTILNHVELSLKQIADAPLIEHYYNSDQDKTTHVGSIAQYWAGINDWFCKLDNEGFYTMEIQNCALASAISIARELDRYETKTDKTIRKMKQRIQELEDEVERLKQN